MQSKRSHPGIRIRHSRLCQSADGAACNCQPSYEASVFDSRTGRKFRKTFSGKGALSAAKAWRADATSLSNRGELRAPTRLTLSLAAAEWVAGATAEPPTILTRSGHPYKPSVLRGYRADLRLHVLPALGHRRLSEVRRGDLQALIDRMLGAGASASKVRNVVMPCRAIFRHALERDLVTVNPTQHLRLPSGLGRRDRAASPGEAAELLAALPEADRPLWATAFYAGLRLGELQALRWSDVDLAGGVIRVHRSWDAKAGPVEPKSRKGRRTVPIGALLRDYLLEQKTRTGRDGDQLVFGSKRGGPFTSSNLRKRARRAWAAANVKRRERGLEPLEPISFHEARHSYVTLMFEAGVPLERIGDYVGHGSLWMSDYYRHLLAGHEAEAARLFDAYLARADTAARVEQLGEQRP